MKVNSFDIIDNLGNVIKNVSSTETIINEGSSYNYFVQFLVKKGDLDYDGDVDFTDKSLLSNNIAGNIAFSYTQEYLGDIDDNGIINLMDLALMNALIYGDDISSLSESEIMALYGEPLYTE